MADWSKMRKTWSDARDKHGVKKGAVSGVSVGDAIDKIPKATGYKTMFAAATALEGVLDKYKAKIAKSHPDFAKWITKTMGDEIKALKGDIMLGTANLTWMMDHPFGDAVVNEVTMLPDLSELSRVATHMKNNPAKTWAEAAEATGLFNATLICVPKVAKRGLDIQKMQWPIKPADSDKAFALFSRYAGDLIENAKLCSKWVKVTSAEQFLQIHQAARQADQAESLRVEAIKAVKKMLA